MKTKITLWLILGLSAICLHAQKVEKDTLDPDSNVDLISGYYKSSQFRPFEKGGRFIKLSFSLSDKDLQNVSRLFDKVESGKDFTYRLQLSGGQFIKDYLLIGAGFGISESKFEGTLVSADSDTISAESISRNFSFSPYVRITLPLTKNQRLSFYNDFGMTFGFGQGLTRDTQNLDEIEKESSDEFVFGIGLSPGVTFFAIENFALEAGVNLVGYRLNVENSTDGDGLESRTVEHDVSFQLNLLSLNIGLAYYF